MGIDFEIVDKDATNKEIAEDFRCSICTDLMANGKALKKCAHMFCKSCLDNFLRSGGELLCPICQTSFRSPEDITEINRVLRQFLGRVKLNCPNEGCGQQVRYENFGKHKEDCGFELMTCWYCKVDHKKEDEDKHLAKCAKLSKMKKSDMAKKFAKFEKEKEENARDHARGQIQWGAHMIKLPTGFNNSTETSFLTAFRLATATDYDDHGREEDEDEEEDNYDWYETNSASCEHTGGAICVSHCLDVYPHETRSSISLNIFLCETTEKINAKFGIQAWDQNGNEQAYDDLFSEVNEDGEQDGDCERRIDQLLTTGEITVQLTIKTWEVIQKA